jgi:DNA-binding response OmpR family regulator
VRVLIIEDEPKLAKALQEGLEADDYEVTSAHTGEDSFFLLFQKPFDLVVLDVMTHTIDLTGKEYDILAYLFRHSERVVSREMLARDVWKEAARQTPLDNVIDVHVTHLRHKVDDRFSQKLLHTVRCLCFVLREG